MEVDSDSLKSISQIQGRNKRSRIKTAKTFPNVWNDFLKFSWEDGEVAEGLLTLDGLIGEGWIPSPDQIHVLISLLLHPPLPTQASSTKIPQTQIPGQVVRLLRQILHVNGSEAILRALPTYLPREGEEHTRKDVLEWNVACMSDAKLEFLKKKEFQDPFQINEKSKNRADISMFIIRDSSTSTSTLTNSGNTTKVDDSDDDTRHDVSSVEIRTLRSANRPKPFKKGRDSDEEDIEKIGPLIKAGWRVRDCENVWDILAGKASRLRERREGMTLWEGEEEEGWKLYEFLVECWEWDSGRYFMNAKGVTNPYSNWLLRQFRESAGSKKRSTPLNKALDLVFLPFLQSYPLTPIFGKGGYSSLKKRQLGIRLLQLLLDLCSVSLLDASTLTSLCLTSLRLLTQPAFKSFLSLLPSSSTFTYHLTSSYLTSFSVPLPLSTSTLYPRTGTTPSLHGSPVTPKRHSSTKESTDRPETPRKVWADLKDSKGVRERFLQRLPLEVGAEQNKEREREKEKEKEKAVDDIFMPMQVDTAVVATVSTNTLDTSIKGADADDAKKPVVGARKVPKRRAAAAAAAAAAENAQPVVSEEKIRQARERHCLVKLTLIKAACEMEKARCIFNFESQFEGGGIEELRDDVVSGMIEDEGWTSFVKDSLDGFVAKYV